MITDILYDIVPIILEKNTSPTGVIAALSANGTYYLVQPSAGGGGESINFFVN